MSPDGSLCSSVLAGAGSGSAMWRRADPLNPVVEGYEAGVSVAN